MLNTSMLTFGSLEQQRARNLVQLAIQEDLDIEGDITSQAVIPAHFQGKAHFVARQVGVLSGSPIIELVTQAIDPLLNTQLLIADGSLLKPHDIIGTMTGPLRSLLSAERIALNFLQRLSGIASLTHRYVEQVRGTSCQVLDTRKTTPAWRVLEKYAVRCGGGTNHRMGLHDAVMIKDNHLAGLREHGTPLAEAVRRAKSFVKPGTVVEVEVENLQQLQQALEAEPTVILLDNMKPELLRQSVDIRNNRRPQVKLEASGGITLQTLAEVASTGVDYVSVGALTHSAPALDIALDYCG